MWNRIDPWSPPTRAPQWYPSMPRLRSRSTEGDLEGSQWAKLTFYVVVYMYFQRLLIIGMASPESTPGSKQHCDVIGWSAGSIIWLNRRDDGSDRERFLWNDVRLILSIKQVKCTERLDWSINNTPNCCFNTWKNLISQGTIHKNIYGMTRLVKVYGITWAVNAWYWLGHSTWDSHSFFISFSSSDILAPCQWH